MKCAKKGMHVLASCRTEQGLRSLSAVTINGKGTIRGFLMDPTSETSVLEMKIRLQDELTTKNKDLFAIVNCPGPLTVGHDDELTLDDYKKSMEQNFFALVRVVHCFKEMLKRSRGRIINLSSVYGKFAVPGLNPHCLSDSCIEVYSDLLRREFGSQGIKTIVVQGGFLRGAGQVVASLKETWEKMPQPSGAFSNDKEYRQKVLCRVNSKENSIFHCPFECWTTSCLFNAIVSAYPRRRYVIGFSNMIFFTPISLIPAIFQDFLLRFYWFLPWFPRCVHCVECTKDPKTIDSLPC
ncbi:CRE-DHS-2 protein [Aphelenchoides bicaudatus]|nr:CRE-DHS-2 protein [Aphelenchoides bicaudatus]